MGDLSLKSYMGDDYEHKTHEAFQLKVERVKFEHANRYCLWKSAMCSDNGLGSLPSFANMSESSPSPLVVPDSSPLLVNQVSADVDNDTITRR